MILVTGASGTVGREVMKAIQPRGAPFKAMYRNAAEAAANANSLVADFGDRNSLLDALRGIRTVYVVCSPIPQLVGLESNVISACLEAGVSHVVLNSALGAADYPKSFPAWHREVEDRLKNSGLDYTIFRPNGFMQNILAYDAPSIRSQDVFYSGMGNARTSFVDVRDIAAAVAEALLNPNAHKNQTYELNGPEAISNDELAEKISRVTGRRVQHVNISEEDQSKSMRDLGMPEWQITALLDLQRYYTLGQGGEVTDVLPGLLGQPLRTVDQFLEEFKASFNS